MTTSSSTALTLVGRSAQVLAADRQDAVEGPQLAREPRQRAWPSQLELDGDGVVVVAQVVHGQVGDREAGRRAEGERVAQDAVPVEVGEAQRLRRPA